MPHFQMKGIMNPHCVPEWEPAERDLDFDIFESDDFAYQSKSKIWDLGPPKKPDVAFVPDDDFEELCWENGQLLVVMQGLGNRSGAKGIGAHPNVAADRASPPKVTSKDNVNRSCITWEPNPVELNPSSCTNFTQDDDLLSWLQHPQDDNLNAKCLDATCTHTLSASKTITQNSKLDTALGCMPQQKWMQGGNNLHVADNYDLAVSASNNAHCLTRSTACNGVCGSSGEHEAEKGSMPCNPIHMGISSWTDASNSESSLTQIRVKENTAHGQGTIITCSMHAPGQGHELQNECECSINSSRVKGKNFANFSRPATAIKADLHTVGIASGPSGANRVKQQERLRANFFVSEPSNLTTEPVVSTTTLKEECSGSQSAAWSCTPHAGDSLPQGKQDIQGAHHRSDMSMAVNVDLHGSTDIPNTKQVVAYSLAEDSYQSCQVTEQNEEVSESKPAAALKRSKHSSVEDSSSGKKTHKKKGSAITSQISKRNRTAESHNLSERKRRSKIKEKMIALQELIPNVNKTDKASMLEEAIAYLKSLQQKVQIMAFRGGLNRQWTSHFPLQIPGEEKTVLPRIPMDASMHEVLDMASKVSDLPVVQGAPLSPLHSSMMMPATIGQPLPRTTLMTAPFAGIVHQGLTHPAYQMYLPVQPVILPNVMHPVYKSER